jgi:thiamine-phosphate pyrophosphorylase
MYQNDIRRKLRLIAVSDGKGDLLRLERVALAAALGGATAICIREPHVPTREKVALTRSLVETLRPHGVCILMNDRLDVAMSAGADGAQLGFRSLPLDVARRTVPREFLLGFSAHEGDNLDRIAEGGADFALLGPIFETPSKRGFKEPIGAAKLQMIAAATRLPVVGIGGIEPANAASVRLPNIAGIAVVRAIFESPDPTATARELRTAIG